MVVVTLSYILSYHKTKLYMILVVLAPCQCILNDKRGNILEVFSPILHPLNPANRYGKLQFFFLNMKTFHSLLQNVNPVNQLHIEESG